jgi:hypothetical protein
MVDVLVRRTEERAGVVLENRDIRAMVWLVTSSHLMLFSIIKPG